MEILKWLKGFFTFPLIIVRLEERLNSIEKKQDAFEVRLDRIENNDLKHLDEKIDKVRDFLLERIDKVNDTLNNRIDKVNDTLTDKFTSLSKDISYLSGKVEGLAERK